MMPAAELVASELVAPVHEDTLCDRPAPLAYAVEA
jgi:hypothetical protein